MLVQCAAMPTIFIPMLKTPFLSRYFRNFKFFLILRSGESKQTTPQIQYFITLINQQDFNLLKLHYLEILLRNLAYECHANAFFMLSTPLTYI